MKNILIVIFTAITYSAITMGDYDSNPEFKFLSRRRSICNGMSRGFLEACQTFEFYCRNAPHIQSPLPFHALYFLIHLFYIHIIHVKEPPNEHSLYKFSRCFGDWFPLFSEIINSYIICIVFVLVTRKKVAC